MNNKNVGIACLSQFWSNIFLLVWRYIFTFALGAGPVTGIIIPELSSAQTRSKVMGFSFSVHWVCFYRIYYYCLHYGGVVWCIIYDTYGHNFLIYLMRHLGLRPHCFNTVIEGRKRNILMFSLCSIRCRWNLGFYDLASELLEESQQKSAF